MIVPKLANKEFLLKVPKIAVSKDGKCLGIAGTIVDPLFEYWTNSDSQLRSEPWFHYRVHYGLSHYNINNVFSVSMPIGFPWYAFKNI